MLKLTLLVIALTIGGVLILAATRPDHFRVQRTAIVQAPADKIYPLISDLRQFNTWNPYEKKDPNIVGAYAGPASGAGVSHKRWRCRRDRPLRPKRQRQSCLPRAPSAHHQHRYLRMRQYFGRFAAEQQAR